MSEERERDRDEGEKVRHRILVTAAVGLSVTSVGLFPSSHPSLPTSVRPSLVSSLYGSASRYG